jgi:hypothetical protein
MPDSDDLKLLAVYSLFGVRTINNANLEIAARAPLALSTKSRFGVFVTLYRNDGGLLLDDMDAHQIHGCLGHWNSNYHSMHPVELVAKIQQLAQDVRTKDDRHKIFSTDVDQDASATIEISLMNLPLREIDVKSQNHFNNKNHGLLVDSGNGKRATYLPGVYPNASWTYISQSLRQKAGIDRTSSVRFYAYDTTVISFQVYDVLFSAMSLSYLRTDVAFFYLKNYNDFVPYAYNTATHAVSVDTKEAVRNIACITDVIGFAQEYKVAFQNKPILPNLEQYYQKWLKNPDEYQQASIFLIRAYHRLGVHRSRIQMMCGTLYAALAKNSLEPQFEMGEAVSVLARVSAPRIKVLKRILMLMRERAEYMLDAKTTPLDNVFELNWQGQSVYQVFKMEIGITSSTSRMSSAHSSESEKYVTHAILLFHILIKTVQRTITQLSSLETNYLAVIYECLTNLEAVMVLSEKQTSHGLTRTRKHDLRMVHDEIRNHRLYYFSALVKMRRGEYGLYYFKDGKHARLDITGHVISSPL